MNLKVCRALSDKLNLKSRNKPEKNGEFYTINAISRPFSCILDCCSSFSPSTVLAYFSDSRGVSVCFKTWVLGHEGLLFPFIAKGNPPGKISNLTFCIQGRSDAMRDVF